MFQRSRCGCSSVIVSARKKKEFSDTGTRTRAAVVRAPNPDQLDYVGTRFVNVPAHLESLFQRNAE